jgi:uncharacterized membrane protein (UPF0127 family)
MALLNQTKNTILAQRVVIADNPLSRMKGLLGRKIFLKGEALVIKPCNAIHTFFMRFAIDCLFLDHNSKVVRAITNLKPWRITSPHFSSHSVIELPSGVVKDSSTKEGDIISL